MTLKPWLWLTPQFAHRVTPTLLKSFVLAPKVKPPQWRPLQWRGLTFPNRLGIAGGVDKDAQNISGWWTLGAGFVEIGTVTPKPQPGNTAPVIDRDVSARAIWNRLGFPSQGVQRVKARLEKMNRPFATPIFANIGKNAATPLDQASGDYIHLLGELNGLVDGFVVNISSPNTKGLRDLLKPDRLREFLTPIMEATKRLKTPVLLKISPDLEGDEMQRVLEISDELGIDGWIFTNTSAGLREGLNFPAEGGVSGRPLSSRSKEVLKEGLRLLGPRREGKLIVSVGGVMSAADVQERLDMGADLVQVYAALIFDGPLFFRRVAKWQSKQTA